MSVSEEPDGARPRYGSVLDGVERLTAEEMDEQRQQNMAYEYLCHLEEAKRSVSRTLQEVVLQYSYCSPTVVLHYSCSSPTVVLLYSYSTSTVVLQ
uniref:Uncharacterized protein n=1 Tax=Knipowitschia caucasica TaxID=637954 RepID=A0AAV2LR76_KNICA